MRGAVRMRQRGDTCVAPKTKIGARRDSAATHVWQPTKSVQGGTAWQHMCGTQQKRCKEGPRGDTCVEPGTTTNRCKGRTVRGHLCGTRILYSGGIITADESKERRARADADNVAKLGYRDDGERADSRAFAAAIVTAPNAEGRFEAIEDCQDYLETRPCWGNFVIFFRPTPPPEKKWADG